LAGDKLVFIFCGAKRGVFSFARLESEAEHQLTEGIDRTFHHGWSVTDTLAEALWGYFFGSAFPLPHSFFFFSFFIDSLYSRKT